MSGLLGLIHLCPTFHQQGHHGDPRGAELLSRGDGMPAIIGPRRARGGRDMQRDALSDIGARIQEETHCLDISAAGGQFQGRALVGIRCTRIGIDPLVEEPAQQGWVGDDPDRQEATVVPEAPRAPAMQGKQLKEAKVAVGGRPEDIDGSQSNNGCAGFEKMLRDVLVARGEGKGEAAVEEGLHRGQRPVSTRAFEWGPGVGGETDAGKIMGVEDGEVAIVRGGHGHPLGGQGWRPAAIVHLLLLLQTRPHHELPLALLLT